MGGRAQDRWLLLAAGPGGGAPVTVHQDAHVSVVQLDAGREIDLAGRARPAGVSAAGGGLVGVDGVELDERDALEIVDEDVVIAAQTTSHVFVIEMAKPD